MTISDVAARIEQVRVLGVERSDNDAAHSAEDYLWEEVLEAIANGTARDPVAMARLALTTRDLKFTRWYS